MIVDQGNPLYQTVSVKYGSVPATGLRNVGEQHLTDAVQVHGHRKLCAQPAQYRANGG